ncbi:MAG: hypothetical protein E7544_02615 [Ruminococcaceae bacterium]|nr:hypothetical protein [Oscillospiraceae bacterium]
MYNMKYAKGLKLLCCIGKLSKYLYYAKKILCICFFILAAVFGLNLIAGKKCGLKALKGMF